LARRFTQREDTLLAQEGTRTSKKSTGLLPETAAQKLSKYSHNTSTSCSDTTMPTIPYSYSDEPDRYDGKVLSDSNDFARCEEILRRLEKKITTCQKLFPADKRGKEPCKE